MPRIPDPIFNDTLDGEFRTTLAQRAAFALVACASLALCAGIGLFLIARRIYRLPERGYQFATERFARRLGTDGDQEGG